MDLEIVGRSSSHYTRTARMFAIELGVPFSFRPVFDIQAMDTATYGENPALKIPVLITPEGPLFGTDNICRALIRRSSRASTNIVMRGDITDGLVANAEELTLHVMSNEVTLIMAKLANDTRIAPPKVRASIDNSLHYLDDNIERVLAKLPADRSFSFLEITLYCLMTHLPFREVMDVSGYWRLAAFTKHFGERESAQQTQYHFDQPTQTT